MAERYTYNAIAEHPIIPEFDDNEEKFKWNGALLNLSDLPVSDYTKTIYNVAGSVTPEPALESNFITISLANSAETYEVVATMENPSDRNITVTVTVDGESGPVSVVIPAGSTTAKKAISRPSSSSRPTMEDPSVDPVRDDTYSYKVTIEEPVTNKFRAYYGTYLEKNLSAITSEDVSTMDLDMVDSEGVLLKFEIPPRDIEHITDADIENYKYALTLAIPKAIYDGGSYSLLEHTFQSESGFVKREDIVMNSKQYTLLTRTSEGTEFVSRYMKTIEYQFDLKYTE